MRSHYSVWVKNVWSKKDFSGYISFFVIFSLFFHMGYGNGDESDGGSPWIEKARRNMNRNASNGRDRNWDWPHQNQGRKMSNPEKKKLYSQVNLYFRPFLIDVVDFSTIRNWGLPSQRRESFVAYFAVCTMLSFARIQGNLYVLSWNRKAVAVFVYLFAFDCMLHWYFCFSVLVLICAV